jgi:hypothetical protein
MLMQIIGVWRKPDSWFGRAGETESGSQSANLPTGLISAPSYSITILRKVVNTMYFVPFTCYEDFYFLLLLDVSMEDNTCSRAILPSPRNLAYPPVRLL